MEPSLFLNLVDKYFPKLVLKIESTINDVDTAKGEKPYYFKRFLGKKWSMDGRWEALSTYNQRIMADVIAMDSSIPLKSRPKISSATGEIPKLGMEMALNESDLTRLQLLVRANEDESRIAADLFRDVATCIVGPNERLEWMFLKGLSSGMTVVEDSENVGVEIRLNFQYRAENLFESATAWVPGQDRTLSLLRPMIQAAKNAGRPIRRLLMDSETLAIILESQDAADLYAKYSNSFMGASFSPNAEQLNAATQREWGYVIEEVERVSRYQINGVDFDENPWEPGQIVGINNERLGDVVWSDLAEKNAPVAGVRYQTADDYILVSKYRLNRPSLKEITNSQARAVPVISDVAQIFKYDTTANAGT